MSRTTLRVLLVAVLVLVAFTVVLTSAYAQGGTATATPATTGGAAATATPATLPTTGGSTPASTVTIVLLALGATAGLGGLLLRGLRQPQ